ncbi:MAG: ABC transporter ATP-binding protein [Nocardiopsaceae bacterium]|jgi:ABC-2 type transport system ATP-binding protein|nr:ABC transporter ATP-binding protein [Nocardiopsaceae bacterium]
MAETRTAAPQPRLKASPACPAIEVASLVKRYPKSSGNAVDGISFTVGRARIFGLLGPNGAGKTTVVGMLTTRVRPTSGVARVAGIDVAARPAAARAAVGVVPQRNNLDRSLSIRQNLLFHAAYHAVPRAGAARRAERLLDAFGLAGRAGDKPDLFSGGQSQRVMIARALMHDPVVLFLDEPSTGLDPAARLFTWDRIRELRDQGTTVLLTTHDMDEAEALADQVGIIDHGQLLAHDSPQALVRSLPAGASLDVTVTGPAGLAAALAVLPGAERAETAAPLPGGPATGRPHEPMRYHVRFRLPAGSDPGTLIPAVAAAVSRYGGRLHQAVTATPSLEDVFLQLTGRTLR